MRQSYGSAATLAVLTVALAAPASEPQAAGPIRLQIEGGHQQWVVVTRPELKDGQGKHPFDTALVDQKHNSEVWFTGETLLTNGLTAGLTVQLEANTARDQIDESFLFLKSEPSGMLQLGDTDNAAYKMAVSAVRGGWRQQQFHRHGERPWPDQKWLRRRRQLHRGDGRCEPRSVARLAQR